MKLRYNTFKLKSILFLRYVLVASVFISVGYSTQTATTYNGRKVSSEVKNVMNFLESLSGEAILAGQEEANANGLTTEMDYLKKVTGKLPAIRGFDVRTDVPDPMKEAIFSWTKRRQLVTFSWHMGAPPLNVSYPNSKKSARISMVLEKDTPENKSFIKKLDEMALRLAEMKKQNVPVLWRPFHEMNGGWFWWGPQKDSGNDGKQFIKLWQFMFNYYTIEKKLDNLIWVWSGSYEADAAFYPGDEYVDIVGTDTYHKLDHKRWANEYKMLKQIAPSKPVALTENDRIPFPCESKKRATHWIWFLTWHTQWLRENPKEELIKIYNHEFVITADEMPDLAK